MTAPPSIAPKYLSIADAAAHVGISYRSLRRLLADGTLTRHYPTPRLVVVDREELERYVASTAARQGAVADAEAE